MLDAERGVDIGTICHVDVSKLTREQIPNNEFQSNLVKLFNHPKMNIIPTVRYKVAEYDSPNSFRLVSNETVKHQI